jgi:hypothetical protein
MCPNQSRPSLIHSVEEAAIREPRNGEGGLFRIVVLFSADDAFHSEGGHPDPFPRRSRREIELRAIAISTLFGIASLSQTLHAQSSLIQARVNVPSHSITGRHTSHMARRASP